jgi:hypothetical protein
MPREGLFFGQRPCLPRNGTTSFGESARRQTARHALAASASFNSSQGFSMSLDPRGAGCSTGKSRFQTRMLPSGWPVARHRPSGVKARQLVYEPRDLSSS